VAGGGDPHRIGSAEGKGPGGGLSPFAYYVDSLFSRSEHPDANATDQTVRVRIRHSHRDRRLSKTAICSGWPDKGPIVANCLEGTGHGYSAADGENRKRRVEWT